MMLPLQQQIVNSLLNATKNPDLPEVVRKRIMDQDPIVTRWERLVNQLNIIAKAAVSAGMLVCKKKILDEKVEEAKSEYERTLKAAGRALQKVKPGRPKMDVMNLPMEWGPKMGRAPNGWRGTHWTREPDVCDHPRNFC